MKRLRHHRGFTLVELMIVLIVLGVLAAIAVPSFKDFRLVQRLKSINSQVLTDMQYARGEAVARNTFLRVAFRENSAMTCYSLYILASGVGNDVQCDCRLGAGAACPLGATEVRTVQVPTELLVTVTPVRSITEFAFDNVTGQLVTIPSDTAPIVIPDYKINTAIGTDRVLRTIVGRTGRPMVCTQTGTNLGAPAC
nr:GspH/FimT family pseudopilin [uncultured Roseateles sp.]